MVVESKYGDGGRPDSGLGGCSAEELQLVVDCQDALINEQQSLIELYKKNRELLEQQNDILRQLLARADPTVASQLKR